MIAKFRTQLLVSVVFAALVQVTAPVLAHHSNNYQSGEPVRWMGAIARVSWDGAHVMYLLDIPSADGSVKGWQVLGASPWRLSQRGIFKRTLKVGEVVTVSGYLNTGSGVITPVYLSRPDGRKLFVGYDASDAQFVTPPLTLPDPN